MVVSRLVPLMLFFFLFSAGEMLFFTDPANAACCNCYTGLPNGCYWCGNCYLRATAFVNDVAGANNGDITISTKNSGDVRIEASPEVIQEILDLRQNGKIAYGDFLFKANGSENNLKLKCIGFAGPIDKSMEDPNDLNDPILKRNIKDFEKAHPPKKGQSK